MSPLRGFAFAVIPASEPESRGVGFGFPVNDNSQKQKQTHWIPDRVRYDGKVKIAGYRIVPGIKGEVAFDCHSGP